MVLPWVPKVRGHSLIDIFIYATTRQQISARSIMIIICLLVPHIWKSGGLFFPRGCFVPLHSGTAPATQDSIAVIRRKGGRNRVANREGEKREDVKGE